MCVETPPPPKPLAPTTPLRPTRKQNTYPQLLVSIVTPSYNQGRFIEETIRSVLSQDYPWIEYIVVDGGSTDETIDILKKYGGRLSWISEKDNGQADAINKGFGRARGNILGWLNSDDTYHPGAVRKAVGYLEENRDLGLVYGEGYHVDEDGRIIERYQTEPFDTKRLGEVCFICQPAVFMRADVFRVVGPLDAGLRYSMDYDYWIRVSKRCRLGHLKEDLANSRIHRDTKTLSSRTAVHHETIRLLARHYGWVPLHWIRAHVYYFLSEKWRVLRPAEPLLHTRWWITREIWRRKFEWKTWLFVLLCSLGVAVEFLCVNGPAVMLRGWKREHGWRNSRDSV